MTLYAQQKNVCVHNLYSSLPDFLSSTMQNATKNCKIPNSNSSLTTPSPPGFNHNHHNHHHHHHHKSSPPSPIPHNPFLSHPPPTNSEHNIPRHAVLYSKHATFSLDISSHSNIRFDSDTAPTSSRRFLSCMLRAACCRMLRW